MNASRNQDKTLAALSVMKLIQSRNGRFLRRIESSSQEAIDLGLQEGVSAWTCADNRTVLKKIKQAFRDIESRSQKTKRAVSAKEAANLIPEKLQRQQLIPHEQARDRVFEPSPAAPFAASTFNRNAWGAFQQVSDVRTSLTLPQALIGGGIHPNVLVSEIARQHSDTPTPPYQSSNSAMRSLLASTAQPVAAAPGFEERMLLYRMHNIQLQQEAERRNSNSQLSQILMQSPQGLLSSSSSSYHPQPVRPQLPTLVPNGSGRAAAPAEMHRLLLLRNVGRLSQASLLGGQASTFHPNDPMSEILRQLQYQEDERLRQASYWPR
jgi:hypothetical protein